MSLQQTHPYFSNHLLLGHCGVVTHPTVLMKGRSYVSIGFVDLQQLLEAKVVGQRNEGPVVWRGFDMSMVVVARAKLILGLLKQADICSEQVLQIWYSSCLTHVTVQLFFRHLAGTEQDLVLKKLMLLWSSAKLDANKAAARWSQALALVDQGNPPSCWGR